MKRLAANLRMNVRRGLGALLLLSLAGVASCGPLLEDLDPPAPGTTCFSDSECVPNGCCGQATRAIHVNDATSCAGVTCSGSCPVEQVQCGCGIPICKDGRCSVAFQTGPGCN